MRTESANCKNNNIDGRRGPVASMALAVVAVLASTSPGIAALSSSPSRPTLLFLLRSRDRTATTTTTGRRRNMIGRVVDTRVAYKNSVDDGNDKDDNDDKDDDLDGGGRDDPFRSRYDALSDAYDDEARLFLRASSPGGGGGGGSRVRGQLDDDDDIRGIKAVKPAAVDESAKRRFVPPIQLIKKVPRVVPLSMSTVSFLRLVGEWPAGGTTAGDEEGVGGGSGIRRALRGSPPPPPEGAGEEETTNVEATKDGDPTKEEATPTKTVVESWKTRMAERTKSPTAFRTTNYLESLAAAGAHTPSDGVEADGSDDDGNDDADDVDDDDDDDDGLLRSLRNQRDQIVESRREAMRKAMRDAARRTSPEDVIARRNEEAQAERMGKENARLERLYAERRERLDAKKRRAEERGGVGGGRTTEDGLEQQRREKEGRTTGGDDLASSPSSGPWAIPVLDIFGGRKHESVIPPLLVGSALTMSYSDLTPCQRRAVEVALSNHESSAEAMEDEGVVRRRAAPLIAIVDGHTAHADPSSSSSSSRLERRDGGDSRRRYATLASIEILDGDDRGVPSTVRLVGVVRAFLRDYSLTSKGTETSAADEEEELSDILSRIRMFDRMEEDDEGLGPDHDHDELTVIMAEFDVFLDDPSIPSDRQSPRFGRDDLSGNGASSAHAVAELYRAANRVYRLHEERKRLVAGLRAGAARLRLGKERMIKGDLDRHVEFEDCDGLGVVGWAPDDVADDWAMKPPNAAVSNGNDDFPIGRELEAMENYGFGSYGILSTVPDLTRQLMSQLEPYYSPAHQKREEYEAEVASMAVLRTLEEYATPAEVAAGLLAPSATHRLELALEVMMRHKEKLHELVRIISEELMDCEEECTDL